MIAFVLAAGFGTRFRPVTLTTPKPLIPFLGRPILFHVFDFLIANGVDRFVVNTHHLGDVLEEKAGHEYRGVPIAYSPEDEILGTAGGIRRASERGLLEDEPFVVANGDVYTTLPVSPLAHRLRASPHLLTVLAVLPNLNPERETPLWARPDGVLIAVGGERPCPEATGPWLFTGLQFASPRLSRGIPEGFSEFARDVLRPACGRQEDSVALVAFRSPEEGHWFDLGSPERLARAEAQLGRGVQ